MKYKINITQWALDNNQWIWGIDVGNSLYISKAWLYKTRRSALQAAKRAVKKLRLDDDLAG